MHRPRWIPADVDLDRPNPARILDYFLGGAHNFAVDRAAAKQAVQAMPEVANGMRASRSFLRRVVNCLVAAGVDQFLDLGSGIPTVGNVHEIAHRINPAARVVYVDNEPIAVAHSRTILGDNPLVAPVRADLRHPDSVLGLPQVREMIDFSRPVGLIAIAVLHYLPDADDPHGLVEAYRDALAPGSYLAVSHATVDFVPEEQLGAVSEVEGIYRKISAQLHPRTYGEVAKFFTGLELIDPGVVPVRQWRSEWSDQNEGKVHLSYGGVARKP
jgi:SAM-dependent methyltransferase